MPEVSRFYGIVIYMYFDDHAPPHFHAEYGEHEAIVGIKELEITGGSLPKRAKSLVLEWAGLHQSELLERWEAASTRGKIKRIAPLP
jgi:hypothetical protein